MTNDKYVNVRVPAKLHVALVKEAKKRHVSISEVMRMALLAELSRGGMPEVLEAAVRGVMQDAVDRAAAKLGAVRRAG